MCDYPENDVDEVYPNLWLGNYNAAINKPFLDQYKIKYIITVMDNFDPSYIYHNITYITIPIKDSDICSINMVRMMDLTSDLIYRILKKKVPVLVHCKRGHHRSATIVAAFLIKYLKMSHHSAISYINNLRGCALRRKTCMAQWLFKYSQQYSHV